MATKPSTHPDATRAARRYPSLKPAEPPPIEEILDTDPPEVKEAKRLRNRYPSHRRNPK